MKLAVDAVAIYRQALAAAQIAAVKAGQEYAAVRLQKELAKQQQERLSEYVDSLKAGEPPIIAMMQDFCQRLEQVNALLQVLDKASVEQPIAAIKAANAALRFANEAAAEESKMRRLFDLYSSIYTPGAPRVQSVLFQNLDVLITALERAWKRLSDEVEQLKNFVAAKTDSQEPFSVDIDAPGAVSLWKTTGDAADTWRVNAFIR